MQVRSSHPRKGGDRKRYSSGFFIHRFPTNEYKNLVLRKICCDLDLCRRRTKKKRRKLVGVKVRNRGQNVSLSNFFSPPHVALKSLATAFPCFGNIFKPVFQLSKHTMPAFALALSALDQQSSKASGGDALKFEQMPQQLPQFSGNYPCALRWLSCFLLPHLNYQG